MNMGLEFLARVRKTSTWLGGVLALMAATYVSPLLGLAFAAGGVWSLCNLQLLEKLVVSMMGPVRSTPQGIRGAGLALMGMLLLLAAGAVLLTLLSPMALLLGFLLPLAVIVLKAASQLLLGSRLWGGIVNHRFRAAFAAVAIASVTWFALGALTSATAENQPAASHAGDSAASAGAGAHAADPHAAPAAEGEHAAQGGEHSEGGGHGFTNAALATMERQEPEDASILAEHGDFDGRSYLGDKAHELERERDAAVRWSGVVRLRYSARECKVQVRVHQLP